MNLYKVLMTHAAPKGYETAIKEYIIAEDDKAVFNYLKDKSGYTYWDDVENDKDEYGDMLKIDYIFEEKGDVNCDDKWCDLYYGSTMYSWNLFKEDLDQEEIEVLVTLEVAKVV
jgi:hypothetical protein